jgi:hypothetical protein
MARTRPRRHGATDRFLLRQVILQELDFKHKHRPLSLARSDREAEYVAEIQQLRTIIGAQSTPNAFFLQQMRHKMALRLHVLVLTTVDFMAGTMTTMALSAVGWRETQGT